MLTADDILKQYRDFYSDKNLIVDNEAQRENEEKNVYILNGDISDKDIDSNSKYSLIIFNKNFVDDISFFSKIFDEQKYFIYKLFIEVDNTLTVEVGINKPDFIYIEDNYSGLSGKIEYSKDEFLKLSKEPYEYLVNMSQSSVSASVLESIKEDDIYFEKKEEYENREEDGNDSEPLLGTEEEEKKKDDISKNVNELLKNLDGDSKVIPDMTAENPSKVILVIDRIVDTKRVAKTYSSWPGKEEYASAKVVNFWAMTDEEDNSYLLMLIDKLKETIFCDADKIEEKYKEFSTICKNWFEAVKKLNPTDVVSQRVFQSDRFRTPELVLWMWGYFVIGRGCNWILAEGDSVRMGTNEFAEADIGAGKVYMKDAEARLTNFDNIQIVSLDNYLVMGCLNYLIDKNMVLIRNEHWLSDNVSFESHIAGAFGQFNRKPYEKSLEDLVEICNGKYNSGKEVFDMYETFIKRYYQLFE